MNTFLIIALVGLGCLVGLAIWLSTGRGREFLEDDQIAQLNAINGATDTGIRLSIDKHGTLYDPRNGMVYEQPGLDTLDASELYWPLEQEHIRRICGVSHMVFERWIVHHPEIVCPNGRIDVIALIGARAKQLFPELYNEGELE